MVNSGTESSTWISSGGGGDERADIEWYGLKLSLNIYGSGVSRLNCVVISTSLLATNTTCPFVGLAVVLIGRVRNASVGDNADKL